MKRSLDSLCLQASRIAICCWIAIAAFFVRVGLKPITSPLIDSVTKLHLLQMFFPGYYCAAFLLMGVSFVAGMGVRGSPLVRPRVQGAFLTLLGLSLVVTTVDWFWVYTPLEGMVREQLANGTAPPLYFREYHTASRHINMVSVSLAGLAMVCGLCNGRGERGA